MTDALTAADILRIWEGGRDRHRVDQALVILRAASPELTDGALARLTIGERDARLLAVRRATFGDDLESYAECPRCAGAVEFALPGAGLLAPPGSGRPDGPVEIEADGVRLRLRPPDSVDLAAVADAANAAQAGDRLLARCIAAVGRDGAPIDVAQLAPAIRERAESLMAELDPHANVTLAVECPACGHGWDLVFDVAAFLWTEIAAAAHRLAEEVHALARAYGWREADILAMSPARRQLYLALAS